MEDVRVVNLADAFAGIEDHWNPRIAGTVNDSDIRLVKLQGEFVWHQHDDEDELFLVVQGELTLRFRDRDRTLRAGEFCIVPRGVEHLPVAEHEVQVLLVEPSTVVNTGNVRNERTVSRLERI